tara:strand:+ start:126 stop:563 length:438 start_codon:yes stop_codon:yes gene_type:complete
LDLHPQPQSEVAAFSLSRSLSDYSPSAQIMGASRVISQKAKNVIIYIANIIIYIANIIIYIANIIIYIANVIIYIANVIIYIVDAIIYIPKYSINPSQPKLSNLLSAPQNILRSVVEWRVHQRAVSESSNTPSLLGHQKYHCQPV